MENKLVCREINLVHKLICSLQTLLVFDHTLNEKDFLERIFVLFDWLLYVITTCYCII